MKKHLLAFLGLSVLLTLPLPAEYRTWTNTEGKTIQAELVKAGGGDVTLRLQNGKVTTFAQSKLAEADLEYINL